MTTFSVGQTCRLGQALARPNIYDVRTWPMGRAMLDTTYAFKIGSEATR